MASDTRREVIISERFEGPPAHSQGGYISGMMAQCLAGDTVEISMRKATPMNKPLTLDTSIPGRVALYDGDVLLNEGRETALDLVLPEPVTFEQARNAAARETRTLFPNCFGCGSGRAEFDGLHMRAGPVGTRAITAIDWTPDPRAVGAAAGEPLPLPMLYAALECSVGKAMRINDLRGENEPVVVGRMVVRVLKRPLVGQECYIVGWPIERARRRIEVAGCMFDRSGSPLVYVRQTFIALRPGVTHEQNAA